MSGIRKLRRLRKLSIPYVANDELLAALAKNCPDLRHLDLAGASEVTAAGAEQLYRAPNTLRLVCLSPNTGHDSVCLSGAEHGPFLFLPGTNHVPRFPSGAEHGPCFSFVGCRARAVFHVCCTAGDGFKPIAPKGC